MQSGFALDLDKVQRKSLQNFGRPMETVFCQGSKCFGGLRHLQKEESQLKKNITAEGLWFQEPMQMSTESGILCMHIIGRQSE